MKVTLQKKYLVEKHCCSILASAIESEMLQVCNEEQPCIAAAPNGSWFPFSYCPFCGTPIEIES